MPGDQCAYGEVDLETGGSYLKATGFMTNSQIIANQVAKRCGCKVERQLVIGNNLTSPAAGRSRLLDTQWALQERFARA